MWWNDIAETKERMDNLLGRVAQIEYKLNCLFEFSEKREEKTFEMFEDYMKNVDKLHGMVNEFKGCVSMARGALVDRKQLEEEINKFRKETMSKQEIYKVQIDEIYSALCLAKEKKSRKKTKTNKKKGNILTVISEFPPKVKKLLSENITGKKTKKKAAQASSIESSG
jgi:hypothetical protein